MDEKVKEIEERYLPEWVIDPGIVKMIKDVRYLLSLLSEKDTQLAEAHKNLTLEIAHSQRAEERVKELEHENETIINDSKALMFNRDQCLIHIKELEDELQLAISHDRQPYPTAWAYEQVCKALHEKEKKIEELEDDLKLNASMLAKQTDLAREAETKAKQLEDAIKDWYREKVILP